MKIILLITLFLISCGGTTWPKVNNHFEISYMIEGGFSIEEVNKLKVGMTTWEQCGNIKFVEVDNIDDQTTYLIQKGDPNDTTAGTSTVGYDENGDNWLILYQVTQRSVLHELGHCLGLKHEHQRYDRCLYVDVNFGNIYFNKWHNFVLFNNLLYAESEYEYDYYSIMHYGGFAFAKDERIPTILSVDQNILPDELGGKELTELDCLKIADIYGEPI